MTWLGIVLSILTLIFLVRFYSTRFKLDFWKFFNWIPLFLFLPYILGSYSYYVIERPFIIPMEWNEVMMILSPYWYKFHFIWISLWILIAVFFFLNSVKIKTERLKWIDVLFYSISLCLVPLWFFLILWDNFIWQPSNSALAISAFLEDSQLYKYNKVYPAWLFLSFASIASFIITFVFNYIVKKYWVWLLWFAVLLFSFNFVFLFQHYSRHQVLDVFWFTLDIKNYWTIFLIGFIWYYFFKYIREARWK